MILEENAMQPDYSTITELPGAKVTKLQLEREVHRYAFGASYCEDKDVLEVACGGGQGLGLLARTARRVVGGDCDKANLTHAHETYRGREDVKVVELDAHELPFGNNEFDVVLLYEAIYYLKHPEKFLDECRRVLRDGGTIVVCTANKNWPDFNPSPFSHSYFSVPEMRDLFARKGFSVEFFGAFPDHRDSFGAKLRSFIKRMVVKFNLMPKSMKGKVLFKRIFYGNMVVLPRELVPGSCAYEPPLSLPDDRENTLYTAIFAVARPV